MAGQIVDLIRSKSREEWEEYYRSRILATRAWIRQKPEQATILAFVIGICLVLFFRLFLWLAVLGVVAIVALWLIAKPAGSESFEAKAENDELSRSNSSKEPSKRHDQQSLRKTEGHAPSEELDEDQDEQDSEYREH